MSGACMLAIKWRTYRDAIDAPAVRLGAILVCLCLLVMELYRAIRPQPFMPVGLHFQLYYNAAVAVRHGADPYAPTMTWLAHHSSLSGAPPWYVYPPLLAVLLIPLTWLPFHTAFMLWGACSVACLLGAICAFHRAAGIRPSLLGILMLAAAAGITRPVWYELLLGQVDLFVLLCLGSALWARGTGRTGLAGLLFGLACVTKPTILLIVLLLLWKREFKLAALGALAFLALLAAPFLWLGGQALSHLVTVWTVADRAYTVGIQNVGPRGVLDRLFTANAVERPLLVAPWLATALWLVVVAGALLLTAACVTSWKLRQDIRTQLEFGLAISAILLVGPLTEEYHLNLLLWALFSVYALLRRVAWWRPPWRMLSLGLLAVWLMLCAVQPPSFLASRPHASSTVAYLYLLVSTPFLCVYVLIAVFGLQLHALCLVSQWPVRSAIAQFARGVPALARSLCAIVLMGERGDEARLSVPRRSPWVSRPQPVRPAPAKPPQSRSPTS